MKRWALGLLLLSGCVQNEPGTLAPPGRIEVSAPESLQRPVDVSGWEPLATTVPRRPTTVTGSLVVLPAGATQVTQVRQITVHFDVADALLPGPAAVEFLDPNGTPYQRDEAAITATVPVERLSFELLVAGTAIDANKLTGVWTARLMLEGKTLATQTFELTR
jgi:hypothetical protein